ncbi:hypothetical protein HPG69_008448 [Diceros bicornis minor]|uniref:Uncharacterized protein n=1 Tax=Diceros bicornis minor TaxID=77932 RepID=A0A7J7FKS7_DICBM|nr:hypothetical protein HPG69_008448 [Diceros bicornis minor]
MKESRMNNTEEKIQIPVACMMFLHAIPVPKSKSGEAAKVAIDVGFRHFDSTHLYQNVEEISKAL